MLVMLCDVSGSMLQFSEFALRFLKSLSEVSDASRIFLFSEELHEVDAFALQNMDAFRDYVRSSGLYGKGTDLGTALEQLCTRRPPILGPSATLLILSDTKTIDLPRALAGLEEAKRQAGKVLWLNPIPGAEMALCPQYPDRGLFVPDGALQHPGGAGESLQPSDADVGGCCLLSPFFSCEL